jgi:hypothetical protein
MALGRTAVNSLGNSSSAPKQVGAGGGAARLAKADAGAAPYSPPEAVVDGRRLNGHEPAEILRAISLAWEEQSTS